MTRCRALRDDLVAAAIGDARPAARRRVARHVARCPGCRGRFEHYRAIDVMVRGLRSGKLPAPSARDVIGASGGRGLG